MTHFDPMTPPNAVLNESASPNPPTGIGAVESVQFHPAAAERLSAHSLAPRMAPVSASLRVSGPGWHEHIAVKHVARCLLYNSMEPDRQWHEVIADWNAATSNESQWRLPCRVEMPFIGEVIRFELVFTQRLELGAWEISIPFETLEEKDPTLAQLLTIDLLPDFAAAAPGSEGTLFLPCLSGALHNFHHRVSREVRLALYGRQEQWASKCQYNVFGMHRPELSWFCIVTQGDNDAEVVARSHWEDAATYSVHAGLVYRWEPNDELLPGTRTARYYLLNPADRENSDWAAFGRIYRRFLSEELGLKNWHEKAESDPNVLNFARGFLLKIMQGYKTSSFDGKGTYQSTASFNESRQILEKMRGDGISSFITAQMVGWNLEGHDGLYPKRFPVNPVEGGEADFRRLIEWGHQSNICVSVHDNYSDSYQNSPEFNFDDVIVLRDGHHWRNIPWSGGFNWRLCPRQSLKHAKRDLPRMRELGIHGNYYIDAIASFMTCHSHQHGANRTEMFAAFNELLDLVRGTFGTASTEVACAPYFSHIDGVYFDGEEHFLDAFTPFRQQWVDETVPFAAIVIHNSIRYQRRDDAQRGEAGKVGALRALAFGAMPFVEISARPAPGGHQMPHYEDVATFCRESHQLCCVDHVELATRDLEEIRTLEPDVYRSRFEDGIELFTNATGQSVNWRGIIMPPYSAHRIQS